MALPCSQAVSIIWPENAINLKEPRITRHHHLSTQKPLCLTEEHEADLFFPSLSFGLASELHSSNRANADGTGMGGHPGCRLLLQH